MNLKRRMALARWLLIIALLGVGFCAAQGGMLMYFMRQTGDVSVFRPSSAEEISRKAVPFQRDTRETNGLFRIVQEQHAELSTMYARLEAAEEMNGSLAVVGTAVLALLTLTFAACLALVIGVERHVAGNPRKVPRRIADHG